MPRHTPAAPPRWSCPGRDDTSPHWHATSNDVTHTHPQPSAHRTTHSKCTFEQRINLVIQVNGKVRDQIEVAPGLSEADVRPLVLERPKVRALLDGGEVRRLIYVPNRLVNLVVK
jgi:leucyl-tRNA synthetase